MWLIALMFTAAVDTASRYVGVQEEGYNRGALIDTWNRFVGAPLGSPYCSAFVSWVIYRARAVPRGRFPLALQWSRVHGVLPPRRSLLRPGMLIVWRRGSSGWRGHVGFCEAVRGDVITTIEANTSPPGMRSPARDEGEGDGVWRKLRSWERNAYAGNAFRIVALVPLRSEKGDE